MAERITIEEALVAAMSPYALPPKTIKFLLIQQGLSGSEYYDNSIERELYSAVIEGLVKVKSLKKEQDPGSENDYDTDKIDEMIDYYRRKYDLEEEVPESQFINLTDEF